MKIINLNYPVSQLEIGSQNEKMRIAEALKQYGIESVGQLCRLTEVDLRHGLLFGDLTVMNIENALGREGLRLGMTDTELATYTRLKNHFQQQYEKKLAEHDSEVPDLIRRIIERNICLKEAGNDYGDESYDDINKEDDYEEEDCDKDIAFVFHNDIHMPKSDPKSIDWDERFYEIAKEEFLRQGRSFTTDETRAERAIMAADIFLESLKLFYKKGKEGKENAEKEQETKFHR